MIQNKLIVNPTINNYLSLINNYLLAIVLERAIMNNIIIMKVNQRIRKYNNKRKFQIEQTQDCRWMIWRTGWGTRLDLTLNRTQKAIVIITILALNDSIIQRPHQSVVNTLPITCLYNCRIITLHRNKNNCLINSITKLFFNTKRVKFSRRIMRLLLYLPISFTIIN